MSDPLDIPTSVDRFLELLAAALRHATQRDESLGLAIIHLSDFDRLVSTYGFRVGNEVAVEIFRRLVSGVRRKDAVVRIAESKFAVILGALRNPGILILAANKLGEVCSDPIRASEGEISVTLRMGLASASRSDADPEMLHRNAETALLAAITDEAKYTVFAPAQRERASDLLQLDSELERAIRNKAFELHYQPKVTAHDNRPCGAEALLRWHNPRRGPISPEVFIPLADRPGRMEPLTAFVLSTAIRNALEWPDGLPVSINISAGMLLSSEFIEMVQNALGMWEFPPERLCIEITEGALMTDPDVSRAVLNTLRELGIEVSIDDFGTGYSSLAYFKNIPADELKIDKSFVLHMLEDESDERIVNAVIQLSRGFGMQVTAEGVEDEATARALARLGCERLQGFYFARPLPQAELLAWLDNAASRRLA